MQLKLYWASLLVLVWVCLLKAYGEQLQVRGRIMDVRCEVMLAPRLIECPLNGQLYGGVLIPLLHLRESERIDIINQLSGFLKTYHPKGNADLVNNRNNPALLAPLRESPR